MLTATFGSAHHILLSCSHVALKVTVKVGLTYLNGDGKTSTGCLTVV